jgi:hypothetical protein
MNDPSSLISELLTPDAGQNDVDAAHDIACGEWDDDLRRQLYSQLFGWCVAKGRWGNARIFAPYAHDFPAELQRSCVENAVAFGRAEDALEGAEHVGLTLGDEDLKRLAKAVGKSAGQCVLWQLLMAASSGDGLLLTTDWVTLTRRETLGQLSDAESIAYRYAAEALHTGKFLPTIGDDEN